MNQQRIDKTDWLRVGVDQDGVIADWNLGMARYLGWDDDDPRIGRSWDWLICPQQEVGEPGLCVEPACGLFSSRNQMWRAIEREGLFGTLPLQDDTVVDGMARLNELAHTTLITSAHPWVRGQKLDWLDDHDIHFDDVVFTHHADKWRYSFDFVIDDKPSTLLDFYLKGRSSGEYSSGRPLTVRRRQPWNKDSEYWDRSVATFSGFVDIVNEGVGA